MLWLFYYRYIYIMSYDYTDTLLDCVVYKYVYIS